MWAATSELLVGFSSCMFVCLDMRTRFLTSHHNPSTGAAAQPAAAILPVLLQLGLLQPRPIDEHCPVRQVHFLRQRMQMR